MSTQTCDMTLAPTGLGTAPRLLLGWVLVRKRLVTTGFRAGHLKNYRNTDSQPKSY